MVFMYMMLSSNNTFWWEIGILFEFYVVDGQPHGQLQMPSVINRYFNANSVYVDHYPVVIVDVVMCHGSHECSMCSVPYGSSIIEDVQPCWLAAHCRSYHAWTYRGSAPTWWTGKCKKVSCIHNILNTLYSVYKHSCSPIWIRPIESNIKEHIVVMVFWSARKREENIYFLFLLSKRQYSIYLTTWWLCCRNGRLNPQVSSSKPQQNYYLIMPKGHSPLSAGAALTQVTNGSQYLVTQPPNQIHIQQQQQQHIQQQQQQHIQQQQQQAQMQLGQQQQGGFRVPTTTTFVITKQQQQQQQQQTVNSVPGSIPSSTSQASMPPPQSTPPQKWLPDLSIEIPSASSSSSPVAATKRQSGSLPPSLPATPRRASDSGPNKRNRLLKRISVEVLPDYPQTVAEGATGLKRTQPNEVMLQVTTHSSFIGSQCSLCDK